MTAEALLALLDGVRRTSRGWSARCPAHADKSPSLNIREGGESRILLHCFAGCSPQDICRAVGLTMKDLFAESGGPDVGTRQQALKRRAVSAELAYRQYLKRGTQSDARREGERLIKGTRQIAASSEWPDDLRQATLNRLADAYDAIWNQEGLDYVV